MSSDGNNNANNSLIDLHDFGAVSELGAFSMSRELSQASSQTVKQMKTMSSSSSSSFTSSSSSSSSSFQHSVFAEQSLQSSRSLDQSSIAGATVARAVQHSASSQSFASQSMTSSSSSQSISTQSAVKSVEHVVQEVVQQAAIEAVQAAAVVKEVELVKEVVQEVIKPAIATVVELKSAAAEVVERKCLEGNYAVHMSSTSLYWSREDHSVRSWTEVTKPKLHERYILQQIAGCEDDILLVRQFDFAPSPIREIKLETSVTVDPPIEAVLAFNKKAIHTSAASLITAERAELKLVKVEEDEEGMFEEYWEELKVNHWEEEVRRNKQRREQLMKRIEETKDMREWSYERSWRRSYSPFSFRTSSSSLNSGTPSPSMLSLNSFGEKNYDSPMSEPSPALAPTPAARISKQTVYVAETISAN